MIAIGSSHQGKRDKGVAMPTHRAASTPIDDESKRRVAALAASVLAAGLS